MRGSLIRTALRLGHEVIGQVQRDTALFALPPPREPGKRGPTGLYGTRLDADAVAALPVSVHAIAGYETGPAALRRVSSALPQGRHRPGGLVRGGGRVPAAGPRRACCFPPIPPCPPRPSQAYSNRWSYRAPVPGS